GIELIRDATSIVVGLETDDGGRVGGHARVPSLSKFVGKLARQVSQVSCCRGLLLAFPAVPVLEAHDIVLAQVGARLYLDDVQRNLARVLDAVLGAQRDVRGLI